MPKNSEFTFAGSSRVGHVLLRPGHLDLDRTVNFLSLLHAYKSNDLIGFDLSGLLTTALYFFYLSFLNSDISSAFAPLGRSWHTMTPTSDHTLFMYGGFGTNGDTLSKSKNPE